MAEDIELTSAGFKPLKNLQGALVYKIAVFGLILQMLLSVTSIISSTMQISFLQKVQNEYYESESEMEEAAISNEMRHAGIGFAWLGVYAVTGIFILVWIFKAHKNAIDFGIKKQFTPGWAVGSFFVPFINLLRPYQAMIEVYSCSKSPSGWDPENKLNMNYLLKKPPVFMRVWWALWISATGFDQLLFRWDPELIEDFIKYQYCEIVSSLCHVILVISFIHVIKEINKTQKESFLVRLWR
jgi:hypothetical protein